MSTARLRGVRSVGSVRAVRSATLGLVGGAWAVWVPALLALAVGLYQLSLPGTLSGLHTVFDARGYDEGVYYGLAVYLLHGVVPYRDFDLFAPPGIGIILQPAAWIGGIFGTRVGLAAARVLTIAVASADAGLAAALLRHRGRPAMLLSGTLTAVFPLAVAGDGSVLLEPYLTLLCLAAVNVLLSGGRIAGRRRVFLAGVLIGLGGFVKVWAVLVLAAAVVYCGLRCRDRLAALVAGAAGGFCVPALPFFLLAPGTFWRDVVATQNQRIGGSGYSVEPASYRVAEILGSPGLTWLHLSDREALLLGASAAVAALGVLVASRRSLADADVLVPLVLAACVAGMFAPPEMYDHYAYFTAPFVAAVFALCLSVVCSSGRLSLPAWRSRLPILVAAVAAVLAVPQQISEARQYLAAPVQTETAVSDIVPKGSCVVSDSVSLALVADRFSTSSGCPRVLDPFGLFLLHARENPTFEPPPPPAFVALWATWLSRADYVMELFPYSDYIAWSQPLMGWFAANFTLVYQGSNVYVYRHEGLTPPPP